MSDGGGGTNTFNVLPILMGQIDQEFFDSLKRAIENNDIIVLNDGESVSYVDLASIERDGSLSITLAGSSVFISISTSLVPDFSTQVFITDTVDSSHVYEKELNMDYVAGEVYYSFGEKSLLHINDSYGTGREHISFEFISGTTPTKFSYPSSWRWVGGVPVIKSSKLYQVEVVHKIARIYEVDL